MKAFNDLVLNFGKFMLAWQQEFKRTGGFKGLISESANNVKSGLVYGLVNPLNFKQHFINYKISKRNKGHIANSIYLSDLEKKLLVKYGFHKKEETINAIEKTNSANKVAIIGKTWNIYYMQEDINTRQTDRLNFARHSNLSVMVGLVGLSFIPSLQIASLPLAFFLVGPIAIEKVATWYMEKQMSGMGRVNNKNFRDVLYTEFGDDYKIAAQLNEYVNTLNEVKTLINNNNLDANGTLFEFDDDISIFLQNKTYSEMLDGLYQLLKDEFKVQESSYQLEDSGKRKHFLDEYDVFAQNYIHWSSIKQQLMVKFDEEAISEVLDSAPKESLDINKSAKKPSKIRI